MTDSGDWWGARNRKEYEDDSFKWFDREFRWQAKRIEEQSEWQAKQAKQFAQNAAQLLTASLTQTRDSLVIWMGFIAVVALASAGLWIGVLSVALILLWVWRRNLRIVKAQWHFHRFRNDCFRELLKIAEGHGLGERMLEEDKEFVLKRSDGILYPLAVPPESRETVYSSDLERIETLYREYCSGLKHVHDPTLEIENSELCAAVRRLREHVENVLSKFEAVSLPRVADRLSELCIVGLISCQADWERQDARGGAPLQALHCRLS
jgi:hypothetical protein